MYIIDQTPQGNHYRYLIWSLVGLVLIALVVAGWRQFGSDSLSPKATCAQNSGYWLAEACYEGLTEAAANCPSDQVIAKDSGIDYLCQPCPSNQVVNGNQTDCQLPLSPQPLKLAELDLKPADFGQLFDSLKLANLAQVGQPSITGNPETDKLIRQLATDRGYQARPEPADKSQLVNLGDGLQAQPAADQAWSDLKAAASQAGFSLAVSSAYHSYDSQRQIFTQQLANHNQATIENLIRTSAPPGYSKHHTGYALNIYQLGYSFNDFAQSPAYQWLAANNFQQARNYGFLPSYPASSTNQGPDPNPWEFVYLGTSLPADSL